MTCPAYCPDRDRCDFTAQVLCLMAAGWSEEQAIAETERWAPAHQTDSGPGGAITPPGLTRAPRRP